MNTDGIEKPGDSSPEFSDPGRLGRLKDQMYSRKTQPGKRPRRRLSDVERKIADDWIEPAKANVPPQAPLVTKRKTSVLSMYSPSVLLLVAAIIFTVIAGGIAVFFLASGSNTITAQKIQIDINGPRTIEGGEVVELQIAVQNNNSATLELADLIVEYPSGTRLPSDPSVLMETQRIPLGTIESGGTRNGTVRGILFGRTGEHQDITVSVEYRLSGSSALFVADSKHSVLVSSGTLEISLDANSQAVAGQAVDMTATVTSRAKTVVDDVVMSASYPFGFSETATSPERGSGDLWQLGSMEPGETKTVRILGVLDGQTGDARVFKFVAGTRSDRASKKVDVVLADFEQEVNVTRPFLGMTLDYNDLPAEEYVATAGEIFPIRLTWTNNLAISLSDVVIAATLSGDGLDPFNISAERGFFRSIDSVVLWDKTTTGGVLEQVPAGASGSFVIRLSPKTIQNLIGTENPTIKIELHAAGQRLSEGSVPETIQSTVSESVKVKTDTSITGRALYFENPLGSVGPLPPKVENETTYGILWEIENTSNLVKDAKMTATLPPYVRWLGTVSPSAEYVTFNENNGVVTWNVGKLFANTGFRGQPPRRIVFSIGLVPSTSQVGEVPPIVENQKFTGVDDFTDALINIEIPELTTNLDEVDFTDTYGVIVR
ncbi:hypothetical protein JXR01_02190 [Candidatus Kaiserbacteria bacterium]|nr:MAG: hypothetical protein JXR01_02190 [Candidatus Kaiserbacteria bacterium]